MHLKKLAVSIDCDQAALKDFFVVVVAQILNSPKMQKRGKVFNMKCSFNDCFFKS